ncbi:unnamed protein product [Tuber melanosporum]|uniref:uS12 prolyl 3,4-dihydroxylase n=1 Tax=Tuber melanosporum (strain Mel28) TaxID=656061 RepID=D5GCY9_TUBMM|nr:uncharacterized protein GSTUM_00000881001 [Tuber melanosporum]CAZ82382.1 unnamed protein product [Tuber melanosporum]
MVKRKAEGASAPQSPTKRGKSSAGSIPTDFKPFFRDGLFDEAVEGKYRSEYATAQPYKHAVIHGLIDDTLLRNVRREVLQNVEFTPKETDIYRIHQSGDLANLDGLPKSALKLLPSLRQLRDSLYSKLFRDYVCGITGCGPLSGKKTDMAINVYTPGSHLLAHDDVIGSRRVSYILYLTSPDDPWQPSWGGALRLYPTRVAEDGVTRVPEPEWAKAIPPAWNQLSFFEVQPGLSFHDVEEVYAPEGEDERIRMAISGWFHIPQEGEGGYIEGLEEELAEKSSLQQLQSKNLDFLLNFIAPTYLTPDTLESLSDAFAEDSSVQIAQFLSKSFARKLKEFVKARDAKQYSPENSEGWKVALPPHKHRYLYLQKPPVKNGVDPDELNPIEQLLTVLLPSKSFAKLLRLATGLKITAGGFLARRFRRGLDYTLATGVGGDGDGDGEEEEGEGEDPSPGAGLRVEVCLGITPSKGWSGEDDEEEDEEEDKAKNGKSKGKGKVKVPRHSKFDDSEKTVGGYEMYMAGDSDSDSDEEDDPDQAFKSNRKRKKADPAIYRSGRDNEDDGILFTMPASWNRLGIVLRDTGVLRFVKYISKSAAGDRWDVIGEWGVGDDGESGEVEQWLGIQDADDDDDAEVEGVDEEAEGGGGEDGKQNGSDNASGSGGA